MIGFLQLLDLPEGVGSLRPQLGDLRLKLCECALVDLAAEARVGTGGLPPGGGHEDHLLVDELLDLRGEHLLEVDGFLLELADVVGDELEVDAFEGLDSDDVGAEGVLGRRTGYLFLRGF